MTETNFPPRVFLRKVELEDLCEIDGAEGDILVIYSPRMSVITGHEPYISLKEHTHALSQLREEKNKDLEMLAKQIISKNEEINSLIEETTKVREELNQANYMLDKVRAERDAAEVLRDKIQEEA